MTFDILNKISRSILLILVFSIVIITFIYIHDYYEIDFIDSIYRVCIEL